MRCEAAYPEGLLGFLGSRIYKAKDASYCLRSTEYPGEPKSFPSQLPFTKHETPRKALPRPKSSMQFAGGKA